MVPTTRDLFLQLEGVSPRHFWKDANQFAQSGTGFTLMDNGTAASTAFAAFIEGGQLEIGIESHEAFRGKGYAFLVCAALIDYCLEQGLEPVWACRKENEGSYRLAQKLGFVPTVTLPYYKLGL